MDLTKIVGVFEREFVISYLVPTLIFAVELFLVGEVFELDLIPGVTGALADILTATTFLLTAVVFSVTLMMASPLILRVLQGYVWKDYLERLALTRRFADDYAYRFKPTVDFQSEVDLARATGAPEPEFPDGHGEKLHAAVASYPHHPDFFLPFKIGNFLRAVEVYPYVVYGLDAIGSWQRLQTLVPEDLGDAISAARSQLLFACNVFMLTIVALLLAVALMLTQSQFSFLLLAGGALILMTSRQLIFVAGGAYGAQFAAAYDLYRGKLADQLGLKMPRNPAAEREMWSEVNRVFLYRSQPAWSRLTKFRKRD
jgi:hypothetical protein